MFEDRTRCHADHVGHGLERHTCAAVGILKGVHAGQHFTQNRVTKDVVAFDAASFHELVEKLQVNISSAFADEALVCVTFCLFTM